MNSGFKGNNFSKFMKLQKKILIIGSLLLFIFVYEWFFQTVPALNYALALARLSFHHYILGTLFGLPLPIFIC